MQLTHTHASLGRRGGFVFSIEATQLYDVCDDMFRCGKELFDAFALDIQDGDGKDNITSESCSSK
jgi:hypothetical protein